jgi:hypothetical protein
MHGTTETFVMRQFGRFNEYIYQVHVFQFDVFNRKTFEQFRSWIEPLQQFRCEFDCIYIVGHLSQPYKGINNYRRASDRAVPYEEAQSLAFQYKAKYFEIDVQTGLNCEIMFKNLGESALDTKVAYKLRLRSDMNEKRKREYK